MITAELIIEYKASFEPYLKSKKAECSQLCSVTDNSRWYGNFMTAFIEYSSPYIGLGTINVAEAKQFLERVFDINKQHLLAMAIAELETSDHNTSYLQALFDALDTDAYKHKHRPSIIKAICANKHAKVPNGEKLALKNEQGEYYIADADFFPYAVSNLFAFHILESDLTITKLGL
jgi:hypothetical protein